MRLCAAPSAASAITNSNDRIRSNRSADRAVHGASAPNVLKRPRNQREVAMRRGVMFTALLASTAVLTAPAMAAGYKFEKIATIEMPGPKGHNDIVTYDPSNQMIYASMPDNGLCIVDTRTNKVAHCVPNVPSPNGNAFVKNYVYVNAGDGAGAGKVNAIVVVSKKTWKEVGRI